MLPSARYPCSISYDDCCADMSFKHSPKSREIDVSIVFCVAQMSMRTLLLKIVPVSVIVCHPVPVCVLSPDIIIKFGSTSESISYSLVTVISISCLHLCPRVNCSLQLNQSLVLPLSAIFSSVNLLKVRVFGVVVVLEGKLV